MPEVGIYDLAFIGHFTKDTIIRPGSTSVNMGGAWNSGCHAAAAMGPKALVVTRLAHGDMAVVEATRRASVDVRGYLRVERDHLPINEVWPEAAQYLRWEGSYSISRGGRMAWSDALAEATRACRHLSASAWAPALLRQCCGRRR